MRDGSPHLLPFLILGEGSNGVRETTRPKYHYLVRVGYKNKSKGGVIDGNRH